MSDEDQRQAQFPSLDLVYEVAKERRAEQGARASNLDTKSGFTLAAASVLTSGVGTLTGSFSTFSKERENVDRTISWLPSDPSIRSLVILTIGAIVICYALVIFMTFQAYRLRDFKISPELVRLRDIYTLKESDETKQVLISEMVDNFVENEEVIRTKGEWTDKAIYAIGVEVFLTVVVSILQILML